jgi:hypothetical protein
VFFENPADGPLCCGKATIKQYIDLVCYHEEADQAKSAIK